MNATTIGKIVAGVLVLVAVVVLFVTWRGRETPPVTAPGASASSDATATAIPPTESSAAPDASQVAAADVLKSRFLAFEQAYRILDPLERKEALRPYVTPGYLETLFPPGQSESAYLKSLREGVTSSLDLENAIVSAENIDATTMEVFTQIPQSTVSSEGSDVKLVSHMTVWLLDKSGEWFAGSETVN